jgi:large subunit ribosomal protein L23
MAILDFLKNKEDSQKAKDAKKKAKKPVKASVEKKFEEPKKVETQKAVVKNNKKDVSFSYEAIKKPHISEKATYLAEKNQYIFEVLPNFNKSEIKKAVEGIYNVNVLSVNMVTIPPKKRRLGKVQGWRKKMTKAIVKIKDGQTIEIL